MARMTKENSQFYCTRCGNRGMDIPRIRGREREAGHLKRLFCLHCREEVNHVECKPYTKYAYEDFKMEFDLGNFDNEGNRKKSYSELKSEVNDGKIIYDDWNSGQW